MIELRPQPIGIFPPPTACLLLPQADGADEALAQLLQGNRNAEVPAAWRFFVEAAWGNTEEAYRLLQDDLSPIARYNRFVLMPSPQSYSDCCQQLEGDLRELLAIAAFAAGVVDEIASDFPLDGELLAYAIATSAANDLENNRAVEAAEKIKHAISEARSPSPLLAAILSAQYADILAGVPGLAPTLAENAYREALRLAQDSKLSMLHAELSMKLGMLYQNSAHGQRGLLLQAVNAYQSAIQYGITEETQPELFAQLQNNLGLAYLSMPAVEASSQLRCGIAVQSFRHALQVYNRERYPDMWASVSMNLANALVYAPSSHPEDNLIQAVEIYEDILQVRSRAKDPVAYALVLLNQANALAHLGIFKPALEKLSDAYKLFHWYEQIDQANAAKELVDLINQRMPTRDNSVEVSSNGST